MFKVFLAYIGVLILEVWAYTIYRNSPLVQPSYLSTLLLLSQLGMTWAGLEAARWFLRRSQLLHTSREDFQPHELDKSVMSDWTRLWVWTGLPSGLLLATTCLLAGLCAHISDSSFLPPLVLAHSLGGALLWCSGTYWALPDSIADRSLAKTEKLLIVSGYLSHALGLAAYLYVYPGATVPALAALLSVVLVFYFMFHLGLCCLFWFVLEKFGLGKRVASEGIIEN